MEGKPNLEEVRKLLDIFKIKPKKRRNSLKWLQKKKQTS